MLTGWEKCVEIARNILDQPDGNWSHELDGEPVRFVTETTLPTGVIRVHYRAKGYAGSVPLDMWQKRAQLIEGQMEFHF